MDARNDRVRNMTGHDSDNHVIKRFVAFANFHRGPRGEENQII
jgi:hypothetical protein